MRGMQSGDKRPRYMRRRFCRFFSSRPADALHPMCTAHLTQPAGRLMAGYRQKATLRVRLLSLEIGLVRRGSGRARSKKLRVLGAERFRPFTNDSLIGDPCRPRRGEDAFVLYCELDL